MCTAGMLLLFVLAFLLLVARGGLPPPEEFLRLDKKDIARLVLVVILVTTGVLVRFVL